MGNCPGSWAQGAEPRGVGGVPECPLGIIHGKEAKGQDKPPGAGVRSEEVSAQPWGM